MTEAEHYTDDVTFLMRAMRSAVESGDYDRVSSVAVMINAFNDAAVKRASYEAQRAHEEHRAARGGQ